MYFVQFLITFASHSLVPNDSNINYVTGTFLLVKLATVVKGDQKAPFSISTTPRCRGGRYSFSLDCFTSLLIRTLYCWLLSKEVSSTIFKVFGITLPVFEPGSPGPLANTLPTRPIRTISRLLVRNEGFVCISKSQIIWNVYFLMTSSSLCIYD